jgi:hypothetical protein
VTVPFFQAKVPARGKILDSGCVRGDGVALHRTTVNTPPVGYYYANEKKGLYVFSKTDWEQGSGVTINYCDLESRRPSDRRSLEVGAGV